jgi:hypothetical protein
VSSLCKDSSSSDDVRTSRSQMATSTISGASKSSGSSEVPESRLGSLCLMVFYLLLSNLQHARKEVCLA